VVFVGPLNSGVLLSGIFGLKSDELSEKVAHVPVCALVKSFSLVPVPGPLSSRRSQQLLALLLHRVSGMCETRALGRSAMFSPRKESSRTLA